MDWFRPFLDWFKAYWYTWLSWVTPAIALVNAVHLLFTKYIGVLLVYVGKLVFSADISAQVGVCYYWLSVANTVAPVAEAFTMVGTLASLWSFCAAYRLIKSYVPSIS